MSTRASPPHSGGGPLQALYVQMPAQQLPRLAPLPPKPRPSILLPKPPAPRPSITGAATIAPAPARPIAIASAPSSTSSRSTSSSADSSSPSSPSQAASPADLFQTGAISPSASGTSPSTTDGSSGGGGIRSASKPATADKDQAHADAAAADAASSLAQPSKQWVLPARAKPGRKPIQKGDEDQDETKRKAQNRASQRAFRERKQAHLAELEAKVESFERQGVTQAVEIQRIAQRVQSENDALKSEADTLRARNTELESEVGVLKAKMEKLQAELTMAMKANQQYELYRRRQSSSGGVGAGNDYGCRPPAHEAPQRRTLPHVSSVAGPSANSGKKRKRAARSSSEVTDVVSMSPVPLRSHQEEVPPSTSSVQPPAAVLPPADSPSARRSSKPINNKTGSSPDFSKLLNDNDDDCGFCAENTPCPCRDEMAPPPIPSTTITTTRRPSSEYVSVANNNGSRVLLAAAAASEASQLPVSSATLSQQVTAKKKLWYTSPAPAPATRPAVTAISRSNSSNGGNGNNSSDEEAVCTGDPSKCSACQRDPTLAEFCGAISSIVDAGSPPPTTDGVQMSRKLSSFGGAAAGGMPMSLVSPSRMRAVPFSPTSLYTSTRAARSNSITSGRPRLLSSLSVSGAGVAGLGSPPLTSTAFGGEMGANGMSMLLMPRRPSISLLSPTASSSSSSTRAGQSGFFSSLQLAPLPLLRNRAAARVGTGTGTDGMVSQQRRLWHIEKSASSSVLQSSTSPSSFSNIAGTASTTIPSLMGSTSIAASRSGFQQSSSRVSLRSSADPGITRSISGRRQNPLPLSSSSAVSPPTSSSSSSASSVSHAWAKIRAHPHFPAYTGGLDLLADVVARRSHSHSPTALSAGAGAGAGAGQVSNVKDVGSSRSEGEVEGENGSSQAIASGSGSTSVMKGSGRADDFAMSITNDEAGDKSLSAPPTAIDREDEEGGGSAARLSKRRKILVSEEGVRDALALLDGIVPADEEESPQRKSGGGDDGAPCPCPWLKAGEGEVRRN
ncbi:hypothetical protein CF327_g4175 [Tilletia walkeri]|nr:hypothetical protein CF327_g4175 [Tilletia walkeri]